MSKKEIKGILVEFPKSTHPGRVYRTPMTLPEIKIKKKFDKLLKENSRICKHLLKYPDDITTDFENYSSHLGSCAYKLKCIIEGYELMKDLENQKEDSK